MRKLKEIHTAHQDEIDEVKNELEVDQTDPEEKYEIE